MSDLHSYLREYIEKLEILLKQCDTGNDSCLLQAAYQLWGENDPRYLVLAEFQNALKSGANLTPKRSGLHRPNPPRPSGPGAPRPPWPSYPVQPVPKPEKSDFEQEEQEAKAQIKDGKPVNRR